jgi:hypothetical protein
MDTAKQLGALTNSPENNGLTINNEILGNNVVIIIVV